MIRKLNYTRHLISYQSTYSKLYALFANDSLQIEVKNKRHYQGLYAQCNQKCNCYSFDYILCRHNLMFESKRNKIIFIPFGLK